MASVALKPTVITELAADQPAMVTWYREGQH
jgi:hypothetical protein